MVFAGRERITATFDVSVDKVEKKAKKIEGLEHEAYFFVPQRRQISIAELRRILAEKRIDACGGAVKKPENMHERGFAGTGRAHDRDKFPRFDLQVDAAQGADRDLPADVISLLDLF